MEQKELTQLIVDRMDTMESNLKEHIGMCQQVCNTKLAHVETVANKAHTRLDNLKVPIECLTAHKNKELGFRRAIYVGMTCITIVVAILGLVQFKIKLI